MTSVNGRKEAVTLDTVQSDVHHLYELLDTTFDAMSEMSFVDKDGKPNREMHRVNALLWIARDLAERIASDIDGGVLPEQAGPA